MTSAKVFCLLMLATLTLGAASAVAGSVTYKYDALGRVIEVAYSNGSKIVYTYDAAGNRTSVTRTAGT